MARGSAGASASASTSASPLERKPSFLQTYLNCRKMELAVSSAHGWVLLVLAAAILENVRPGQRLPLRLPAGPWTAVGTASQPSRLPGARQPPGIPPPASPSRRPAAAALDPLPLLGRSTHGWAPLLIWRASGSMCSTPTSTRRRVRARCDARPVAAGSTRRLERAGLDVDRHRPAALACILPSAALRFLQATRTSASSTASSGCAACSACSAPAAVWWPQAPAADVAGSLRWLERRCAFG